MNSFALFTDVSLDPQLKIGLGAYVVVPASFLNVSSDSIEKSHVAELLRIQRFDDTSSTKLEVQTVLWALENFRKEFKISGAVRLHVYCDSQCVAGLPARRAELEFNNFQSKGRNRRLKNAALYRKFYEFYDEPGFELIKISGHAPSCSHDAAQRIFSFVDREVRKALRLLIQDFKPDSIKGLKTQKK